MPTEASVLVKFYHFPRRVAFKLLDPDMKFLYDFRKRSKKKSSNNVILFEYFISDFFYDKNNGVFTV
jgi:hypothetical protein